MNLLMDGPDKWVGEWMEVDGLADSQMGGWMKGLANEWDD